MTSTENVRQPQRLYVVVPASAFDVLIAAATREDRTVKAQAARYVLAGLRQDGYLPGDAADDPSQRPARTRSAR